MGEDGLIASHPEADKNLALSSRDSEFLYENYCDKRVPVRNKETMWHPRAEGEDPRKDKLRRSSDLIEEGVIQPSREQKSPRLVWLLGGQ